MILKAVKMNWPMIERMKKTALKVVITSRRIKMMMKRPMIQMRTKIIMKLVMIAAMTMKSWMKIKRGAMMILNQN